jgi:hypothetical protein
MKKVIKLTESDIERLVNKILKEDWGDYIERSTNELGDTMIDDLNKALKMFGKYTYHDKGADEVMNTRKYVRMLEDKSPEEIGIILRYVLDNHDDSQELIDCIITDMDHRNDFEEILDQDDRFEY